MSKAKPIVIKCPIAYAHLKRPYHDSGMYQVVLSNLTEKQRMTLAEVGVIAKEKDTDKLESARYNREYHVSAKSKYQPVIKDSQGNDIDPEDIPMIKDGSICKMVVKPYNHAKGVGLNLNAVMLVDVEELESKGDGYSNLLLPEEDGTFKVNKSAVADSSESFDDLLADEEIEEN